MGSGASQYKTKEEALAAGITEEQIAEYLKNNSSSAAASADATKADKKVAKKQAKEEKKAAKKQAKADKKASKKEKKAAKKAAKQAKKAFRGDSSSSSASSESSDSSEDEETLAQKDAKREKKEEKAKIKAAKDAEKAKIKAAKDAEKQNIKDLKAAVKGGDADAATKLEEAEAAYKTNKKARKADRDAEKKARKAAKAERKAAKKAAKAEGAATVAGGATKAEAAAGEGAKAEEAAAPVVDWETMFAHKGPYDKQKDRFGPAPDFTKPEGWYWCGSDGDTGPEIVAAGVTKPPVAKRPADCFYIHPTTYCTGDLWNMPISFTGCQDITDYYMATEASAFNGCCRIFCPKFRQALVTAMGYADEGRKATELAYSDVKAAFEVFLRDHNKGRPLVLASHSQGSLYLIRLLQDFVEGKPLLKHVVAIYGIAAWVPLSMFEGSTAVFKQIQVCKAADSTGCFISYTVEHPDTVAAHVKTLDEGKTGDWFVQTGHKCGADWRLGYPIVGTNPLTWSSNGMGGGTPDKWLGMLQLFGKNTTWKKGPVADMDTLIALVMSNNTGTKVNALGRMEPAECAKILEEECKTKFDVKVAKNGDVQIFPLPKKYGGSEIISYEHMNFLLFYFNIRKNLEVRMKTYLSVI